jgi:hypothetical protein
MKENNKNRYYELDEIGFIGTQEQQSPAIKAFYDRKTVEAFKAAKANNAAQLPPKEKKPDNI